MALLVSSRFLNWQICQFEKDSLRLFHKHKSGGNTINSAFNVMNKQQKKHFENEKEFLAFEFKSKATIIDDKLVEVIDPGGESYTVMSQIGIYTNEETRHNFLHMIEYVFDLNFSEDKEIMANNIWRDLMQNAVPFMGMSSGDRHGERTRIGKKIRMFREEKGIEAKDLAKLANIDAANLSRIEQGKYSVGLDILSRIAFVLGCQIDIVPSQM